MKPIILIYHTPSFFGGIQNQIIAMARILSEDAQLYFVSTGNNPRLEIELKQYGVTMLPPVPLNIFKRTMALARIIRTFHIQYVQTHIFNDNIEVRLVKILCPRVRLISRVHTYIICSWIPMYKKRSYYLLDTLTAPAMTAYLVNGEYMMREFDEHTLVSKSKRIGMLDGIAAAGAYVQMRQFHHPARVLMIANVLRHKGHDVLIRALALLSKDKQVHCRVLGRTDRDAPYFEELQSMAKELAVEDNVEFVGFDRDVAKYIAESDIVVLPSDSEGTPNCIMEAMSMGRITISSRTGALDEMVADGIDGFLCRPCDAESFADALQKVLTMNGTQIGAMSELAYKKWQHTMSLDAMRAVLKQVYHIEEKA